MIQVLIVCTGNTCRSPMAEGALRALLPPEIGTQVRVRSAGTNAVPGVPATPLAVSTTGARDIDLRGHQSSSLTPELIRESELILGMEPGHVARARELAPDAADRRLVAPRPLQGRRGVLDDEVGERGQRRVRRRRAWQECRT